MSLLAVLGEDPRLPNAMALRKCVVNVRCTTSSAAMTQNEAFSLRSMASILWPALAAVKEELAVVVGVAQGDRIGIVVVTLHRQDPRRAGLEHGDRLRLREQLPLAPHRSEHASSLFPHAGRWMAGVRAHSRIGHPYPSRRCGGRRDLLSRPGAGRHPGVVGVEQGEVDQVPLRRLLAGPSLYDVVLNMEDLSVEGAVATLAGMTRLDDFRPTPESRRAFDDLLLASEVWSALTVDHAHAVGERACLRRRRVGARRPARRAAPRCWRRSPRSPPPCRACVEVENEVGVGGSWQW